MHRCCDWWLAICIRRNANDAMPLRLALGLGLGQGSDFFDCPWFRVRNRVRVRVRVRVRIRARDRVRDRVKVRVRLFSPLRHLHCAEYRKPWRLYVIVSVGQSDWQFVVLTDEAVFVVARFVVPHVAIFFQQIDTCLFSTTIVRLNGFMPVGESHGLISGLSVVICPFPYKLVAGFGVFPMSCRPYVDSV